MKVLDFISYGGWLQIAKIPADHSTFKKC